VKPPLRVTAQATIKTESKKRTRSPSVASTATLISEPTGPRVSSRPPALRVKQEFSVKQEPVDIDSLDEVPTNKRQKIKQEIIELDSFDDVQVETSARIKGEIIDLDDCDEMEHSPARRTGFNDSHSREPPRKRVKFEEDEDMDVVEIVEGGKPENPSMTEGEKTAEDERIAEMEREIEELKRVEIAMKERMAELRRIAEGDMDC
jgi:hypothetical protein